MAWEKVETPQNFWKPENEGEELVGSITNVIDGQYGVQLTILTKEGQEFTTPSHKVLQNRLKGLKVGQKIKIERKETLAPKVRGQNPTVMYDVFVDK